MQQQLQPDSTAEARERKKMTQPTMLPWWAGSSSGASLEDFPPGLLSQPPPLASAAASVSSCPPRAPLPQSLALFLQGGGVRGSSGHPVEEEQLQITSMTPMQISASLRSNNSITEDTESYDDLDKSHTEDFSSSKILDASLSRATDLGEPECSTSEEMLNNFHEANSPDTVSPNQPHPAQQPRGLTNGSAHPPPQYTPASLPYWGPLPMSGGAPSSPLGRA